MKKINRNIFKPFMFICLGLMAVMLMSATVSRTPGQPDPPKIVDIGPTWCTIEYTPPLETGGFPITGYRIGYRYKDGLWKNTTPIAESCKVKILNLIEGNEVEFRVSAINKEGEGDPSKPSQMVLLK